MYFIIYKTTNNINKKYYIGAHKTNNIHDDYLGSGVALKRAIKKYGRENFTKEILQICDDEKSMFERERELVECSLKDKKCYNMRNGGRGGFDHIDNRGDKNPMRNPKIAKKVGDKIRELRKNNKKWMEVSVENLKKATESNRGKKRPEHSERMKVLAKQMWLNENMREKFKDSTSEWYMITYPCGKKIKTNRLTDFCKENMIPFVTIWINHKINTPITKGKAKGWKCHKITKQ
jgi:hypothetical protein